MSVSIEKQTGAGRRRKPGAAAKAVRRVATTKVAQAALQTATPKALPQDDTPVVHPPHPPDAHLGVSARQMLDAAERLFAERGIDMVSLREIGAAAGQRNLSAAQYHFGSREALVGLVITRRIWQINERRHARIDALEAAGLAGNLDAVVQATLSTLAEVVRDEPWGVDYVRLAAQHNFRPELEYFEDQDPANWSGHVRVKRLMRRLLSDLPEEAFRDRSRIMNNEIVFTLARWVQAHGPVSATTRARYDALVHHTVEFLTAGMRAPHTLSPPAPSTRPHNSEPEST
jgi:AcrR family transcriptional regulator